MKINHETHERYEIIGKSPDLSFVFFVPFVVKSYKSDFFFCALCVLCGYFSSS